MKNNFLDNKSNKIKKIEHMKRHIEMNPAGDEIRGFISKYAQTKLKLNYDILLKKFPRKKIKAISNYTEASKTRVILFENDYYEKQRKKDNRISRKDTQEMKSKKVSDTVKKNKSLLVKTIIQRISSASNQSSAVNERDQREVSKKRVTNIHSSHSSRARTRKILRPDSASVHINKMCHSLLDLAHKSSFSLISVETKNARKKKWSPFKVRLSNSKILRNKQESRTLAELRKTVSMNVRLESPQSIHYNGNDHSRKLTTRMLSRILSKC